MSRSPRRMDREQFRALVRVARDRKGQAAHRDAFMLWFIGRTGLRATEGVQLRVEDAVLEARPPLIRVRTLKQKAKRGTWDDVYLDRATAARLERWLRIGLPRCLRRRARPDDPIFPAAFGALEAAPMTRRNATRIFRFYARRAALPPGITLHSLRHFRGTTLYEVTRDLEFTREQLRHRSLDSTRQYLHKSPEQVQADLDELERALEG